MTEPSPAIDIATRLARMPKAELHLHMEGAIRPETLLVLAERNRIDLPFATPEEARVWLGYRDFNEFVRCLLTFAGCLRRPEDFAFAIERLGHDLAAQNIRYAEVTWTPQIYLPLGIPLQEILDALNEGRCKVRQERGVEMRWIPDLVRGLPLPADEVVRWLCSDAVRDGGVVALGLGGPEQGNSTSPLLAAFEAARRVGLPINPHAGENAGPESVREVCRELRPRRIGHGVRTIEDPELTAMIAAQKIVLEICPTSNLRLGLYPSYAEHPLKRLLQAGCRVTVNSDDPVLFDTSLTREYQHALEDCGLAPADLEESILTALQASYLDDRETSRLVAEFERAFADLKRPPQQS